eukprot:gnl/Chilomastix_cuspidata/3076.p1 GENE.gnl/Chilomastix_cuspidata/3076~~gnl/Chilomastix_cuspidata/3076.p1  ORF type:complete len:1344 (-),score=242.73 gnl/Chilomastix_cuspidata/3076:1024-5055(-)
MDPATGAFGYLAVLKRPSIVTHAISVVFSTRISKEILVLARSDRLELYNTASHKPTLIQTLQVRGTVIDLKPIPTASSSKKNLLVLTEKLMLLIVQLLHNGDAATVAATQLPVHEADEPDGGVHVAIHPRGESIVVRAFQTGLFLVSLSDVLHGTRRSRAREALRLLVTELDGLAFLPTVLDMCFLASGELAVLFEDIDRKRSVCTLALRLTASGIDSSPTQIPPDIQADGPFSNIENVSSSAELICQLPMPGGAAPVLVVMAHDHASVHSPGQPSQRIPFPNQLQALPCAVIVTKSEESANFSQTPYVEPSASRTSSALVSPGRRAQSRPEESYESAHNSGDDDAVDVQSLALVAAFQTGRVLTFNIERYAHGDYLVAHECGVLPSEPSTLRLLRDRRAFVGSRFGASYFLTFPQLEEIAHLENCGPIIGAELASEPFYNLMSLDTRPDLLQLTPQNEHMTQPESTGSSSRPASRTNVDEKALVFCSGGVHQNALSSLSLGLHAKTGVSAHGVAPLNVSLLHDEHGNLTLTVLEFPNGRAALEVSVEDGEAKLQLVDLPYVFSERHQPAHVFSLVANNIPWHASVTGRELVFQPVHIARTPFQPPRGAQAQPSKKLHFQPLFVETDNAHTIVALASSDSVVIVRAPAASNNVIDIIAKLKFIRRPPQIAAIALACIEGTTFLAVSFVCSHVLFLQAFTPGETARQKPSFPTTQDAPRARGFFEGAICATSLRFARFSATELRLVCSDDLGGLAHTEVSSPRGKEVEVGAYTVASISREPVSLSAWTPPAPRDAECIFMTSNRRAFCLHPPSSRTKARSTVLSPISQSLTLVAPLGLAPGVLPANRPAAFLGLEGGTAAVCFLGWEQSVLTYSGALNGLPRAVVYVPSTRELAVASFGLHGQPCVSLFSAATMHQTDSFSLSNHECVMDLKLLRVAVPVGAAPMPVLCVATSIPPSTRTMNWSAFAENISFNMSPTGQGDAGISQTPTAFATHPPIRLPERQKECGRVLLFDVSVQAELREITSITLENVTLSVTALKDGRLAVGSGNELVFLEVRATARSQDGASERSSGFSSVASQGAELSHDFQLVPVASCMFAGLVGRLDARGAHVLVGEMFASVSLVTCTRTAAVRRGAEDTARVQLVAKEYAPRWVSAAALLAEDGRSAVCDSYGNVAVLARAARTVGGPLLSAGAARLEPELEFHLGGQVNAVVQGALGSAEAARGPAGWIFDRARAPLILATADGGVYALAFLSSDAFQLLRALEVALEDRLDAVACAATAAEHRAPWGDGRHLSWKNRIIEGSVVLRWETLGMRAQRSILRALPGCDTSDQVDEVLHALRWRCG